MGDAITDLHENLACRTESPEHLTKTIIRIIDDPDVLDPLRFLRAREIVHFQRFGEALEKIKDSLDSKTSISSTLNLINSLQQRQNKI